MTPTTETQAALGEGARSSGTEAAVVVALEKSRRELFAMARVMDHEIGVVARAFESLAGQASAILKLAASIVGCVEDESVSLVLPKVQALGATARQFIGGRLQATSGILATVTTEVNLLQQLSQLAHDQETIAFEIKALSVLTNIEVAHLGTVGAGFQYLAHELADFSNSVTADTRALASHADDRRTAIAQTRRVLLAELPRMREDLVRIDADLGNALALVDASLTQLSSTPAQFRACVEDIARQIAAVVAAIQSHDINRQMNEHVQEAFALISARLIAVGDSESDVAEELPRAYAGLTIQIGQLKTIEDTVAQWTSQIKTCMSDILRVSTSEVFGIGRAVLEQEQQVSSQLACIERLEFETQADSERTQHSVAGLSQLMQFVGEHVKRAESVRDRLRLLAFNSIIEASHLGTKADAILAISQSIKEISMEWSRITDQSARVLQEIFRLVKETNAVMEAFSESSSAQLREAQAETKTGLDSLRNAAKFTARQAHEMQSANEEMQTKIREIGKTGESLDACFGRSAAVLAEIEALRIHLENGHPGVRHGYDAKEVEQMFSAFYTTELEREVLRAALQGGGSTVARMVLTGNSVELF